MPRIKKPRKSTYVRREKTFMYADLVTIRADNGDWSLHPPKGQIKEGDEVPTLKSGPASKKGKTWDRPTVDDYKHAWQMWMHHQAMKRE